MGCRHIEMAVRRSNEDEKAVRGVAQCRIESIARMDSWNGW